MTEFCLTAITAFCVVCLAVPSTDADVTLPSIISDNMVLQHGSPCPVWGWADARVDGDELVVWSDRVPDPVAVRYGWMDKALAANLYNKGGPGRLDKRAESHIVLCGECAQPVGVLL